jgi:predicted RNA-binding Zn ribbon-like protein
VTASSGHDDDLAVVVPDASVLTEPQPGDRPPAPGELALVQAFVNTFWDSEAGAERLTSPQALQEWLAGHGLLEPGQRLAAADLERALRVREGLRALLFANNGSAFDPEAVTALNAELRTPGLYVQLEPERPPAFKAVRGNLDAALASLATIAGLAQIDGRWPRLKACPGPDCGWAFYDHSRNQNSSWCSMSVCGSRVKAREYRRRRKPRRAT